MSNDSTYEGWTNWETWNVALWVDNEFRLYTAKIALLRELQETGQSVTADHVWEFVRQNMNGRTPDVNRAGMKKVNYGEIAESWNCDMEELTNV